jgi:hypothetical protein
MTELNRISFERLVDWAEGQLSAEVAGALERRVAEADEATRAWAAWLRAFARVNEEVILEAPS